MGLKDKQTYRPDTLIEALAIRAETGAVPYAGGTDLMPGHRRWTGLRPDLPDRIMFIGHLNELTGLEVKDASLTIGPAATLARISESEPCPDLLKQIILTMAAPGVRNLATLGGNICNASPAGDTLPYLYAVGAELIIRNPDRARTVSIEQFITGPGQTQLAADELLTGVVIPDEHYAHVFHHKISPRKANALSKLSMVGLALIKNEELLDIRLAWGAAGPTVVRSRELEQNLINDWSNGWSADKIKRAETWLANILNPIDDQRSTAEYRRAAGLNLARYFLMSLFDGEK